jgi:FMN phosphatase YigB (HAD superfamily)
VSFHETPHSGYPDEPYEIPPQLEYVHRAIADRSCSVLSLDVFDTVLWRRVPRPTDLFELLGARLRHLGHSPGWLTDATFRAMRVTAENEARARSHTGEVSLFEIWQAMPLETFDPASLDDLVQEEVELERAVTVVDLDIAAVLRHAVKEDLPVVLVSDTYFTERQLTYLLDRVELEPVSDLRLFCSHRHGTHKAAGLWEIVLRDLGRSPEQVLHVGDNELADHTTPSELGIRTVPYRRGDTGFAEVLRRAGESLDPGAPVDPHLDPEQGDFGLTGLRVATLRHAPPAASRTGAAWRYGGTVLGPVLTGFAEWVASRAHRAGVPVVWCPMREGELLATLVNRAAVARGWNVSARPVWLSRQVTSIASLDCFDPDSVREFVRRGYRLTVGQLLTGLRLRPGDVPSVADLLGVPLDQRDTADRLARALTEAPHLTNRLAGTVISARERLLRSLRDLGALDRPELYLVDLGWGGTIQFHLDQVLRQARTGVRPVGLYLATDERSTKVYRAGLRAEGYLGQAGHPRALVRALSRSPEVLEQCVGADCGSVVDFADDGTPILGPRIGTDAQHAERSAVQDGIMAFQRRWNRYVRAAEGNWPDLLDGARGRLGAILGAALRVPTPEEAAVFGGWRHEDNFGSEVVTPILAEELVPAIPYLSPPVLDELDMRDAFWPALLAASDTRLHAAVDAVHRGVLAPSVFEPAGEPFETRLRYRVPPDEWHDGPGQRVRINHNGLSFVRLNVTADELTDVSLAIPGRPAIVRVDWIEAVVQVAGSPHPQLLRFDTADDFAGLTFAECNWLGGTMVEFHAPHSALWLPLAARAGAPVTAARISIAFAMLPQPWSNLPHQLPPAPMVLRLIGRAREEYRHRGPAGLAAGAARVAVRRLGGR